jgi:hypothetical protein
VLEDDFDLNELEEQGEDPRQRNALSELREFFEAHQGGVFFSRQLAVQEERYFHWITNRALRELKAQGAIGGESRRLSSGSPINLLWHRRNRYYRRKAAQLLGVVEQYADPNIGAAVGLHREMMVLEAFARCEFVMRGRNVRQSGQRVWTETEHNLDFIFERDGKSYGVEVKNTLPYMKYDEFQLKLRMCHFLGLNPIFAVRMMPKTWIFELSTAGGYAMISKYQLYPWTHKALARRVAVELGLPVDAPRAIFETTTNRLLD